MAGLKSNAIQKFFPTESSNMTTLCDSLIANVKNYDECTKAVKSRRSTFEFPSKPVMLKIQQIFGIISELDSEHKKSKVLDDVKFLIEKLGGLSMEHVL